MAQNNAVCTLTIVNDFADERVVTNDVLNNDYFALSSPEKAGCLFKGRNTNEKGSGEYFDGQIR